MSIGKNINANVWHYNSKIQVLQNKSKFSKKKNQQMYLLASSE